MAEAAPQPLDCPKGPPNAEPRFGDDSDPTGRIPVLLLTVHAIVDPIAFVELEHPFSQTMCGAGAAHRLVQVFTEHSALDTRVARRQRP